MTRGAGPDEIFSNRYIAAYESPTVAAGNQTVRFDLDPPTTFVVDGSYLVNRSFPCSATGATQSRVRLFWVWVGMLISDSEAANVTCNSVSVYETRE